MKMGDLDQQEIHAMQIRALQDRFPVEHLALLNWGAWSRHRCVGPGFARPHIFDQHDGDTEGYAEDAEPSTEAPAKAEAKERDPYEEKPAAILDERIHSPGGIGVEYRRVLRVAYVFPPYEGQMARYSGCHTNDEFCYRLSEILRFVSRFV